MKALISLLGVAVVLTLACSPVGGILSPPTSTPRETPTVKEKATSLPTSEPSPTPLPASPSPPEPTSTQPPPLPTATEPVPSQQVETAPTSPPTVPPAPWRQVRTLLAGPGEPGRLYALIGEVPAGLDDESTPWLLVSDDYGETWTNFPGGLPTQECVLNVNMDYATVDSLYVSTCEGLYHWSGSEWVRPSSLETRMVAVVYGSPEMLWAAGMGGTDGGVLRSNDGGLTWARADDGLIQFNGVATVALAPQDANILYAVIMPKYGGSYLRRGTSGGQWTTMPTPLDNSQIGVGLTIDGANGDLYVMVKWPTSQLWRSRNASTPDLGQVQWSLVHDFGRDVDAEVLASGWGPQGLALYANLSPVEWEDEEWAEIGVPVLSRSLDGGLTWEPLPIPLPPG
jgi:hypothetical protein